jgi:hypothetical protein
MKRSFSKFVERLEAADLHAKVEARALKFHVTLRELYEGPHLAPSINTARRSIYLWLIGEGKGLNEVARLFDRAPSGVVKLTKEKS